MTENIQAVSELQTAMRQLSTSLSELPSVDERPKSMLEVIGLQSDENRWNKLLTYFLDPKQPHGLDGDLLKTVLKQLPSNQGVDVDPLELETVDVRSETDTGNGRADIVVFLEEDWFVLFELKVRSEEGNRQTKRYVEADWLDQGVPKSEFDSECYVYLTKAQSSSPVADEFVELHWEDIIEAVETVLLNSNGRYTARGTAQLRDFRDTIRSEIRMTDTKDQRVQEEKMKLYAQYRNEITELETAFERIWEREKNRWHNRFLDEFKPDNWSDEWNCHENKWGHIFRDDWWLDESGQQVEDPGPAEFYVGLSHKIRDQQMFAKGNVIIEIRSWGRANESYKQKMEEWLNGKYSSELESELKKQNIDRINGKKRYTKKAYTFDPAEGPDGYYRTLARGFNEHLNVANVISKVHRQTVQEIIDGDVPAFDGQDDQI